jgi:hypothetical protein
MRFKRGLGFTLAKPWFKPKIALDVKFGPFPLLINHGKRSAQRSGDQAEGAEQKSFLDKSRHYFGFF